MAHASAILVAQKCCRWVAGLHTSHQRVEEPGSSLSCARPPGAHILLQGCSAETCGMAETQHIRFLSKQVAKHRMSQTRQLDSWLCAVSGQHSI